MAFTFGLGADTMLSQYQRDSGQSKLLDISGNINKYNLAVGTSSSYVEYTYSHLNRFMQQDQENDGNTTFLFEYQALLRARMQQLITDLTAALTRDLDNAMSTARELWDSQYQPLTPNAPTNLGRRASAQGYTSDVEDAGAGRIAYNFFTGFASAAAPAPNGINGVAYNGIPTFDQRSDTYVLKVSPDTSIDATFIGIDPATGLPGEILRAAGTGTIQQSFPQDGLPQAVIDNLVISHQNRTTLYGETGGGFAAHKNGYKFTDIEANRFNTQNIGYLNASIGDNDTDLDNDGTTDVVGNQAGNLNETKWDGTVTGIDPNTGFPIQEYYSEAFIAMGSPANPTPAQLARLAKATPDYMRFNETNSAKNEFQRILYDCIFELDQRNLLRDVFRLSEKNGFLNDVQIASTSSLNTGTQIQASIMLNFVPGSATRNDLGGRIQIIVDRFSAFYHS